MRGLSVSNPLYLRLCIYLQKCLLQYVQTLTANNTLTSDIVPVADLKLI